ncbi:MAG TPA: N-(5'-phosphoribosyl)anthranilate isomerase, partial [Hyphomicrobiaceae bacterium]|nr:N-(5'-phosphoribosyl)anthranilate isomerase [Hyphomicrobiaceae bacterium]
VSSPGDAERAAHYLDAGAADLLLFDAKPPPSAPLPGGNGVPFDWRLLDAPGVRRPFMLAGGLTAENVRDAVRLVGPAFVDVSSGVETSPGVKDADLIRRFIAAARS